jgi:hypothetical protein
VDETNDHLSAPSRPTQAATSGETLTHHTKINQINSYQKMLNSLPRDAELFEKDADLFIKGLDLFPVTRRVVPPS